MRAVGRRSQGLAAQRDALGARIRDLEDQTLFELAHVRGAPPTVVMMVKAHLRKPWIPGHRTVLIRPLQRGLDKFFRAALVRGSRHVWYFPSTTWWLAHADKSHPPEGLGCDRRVHVDFLTERGARAEFAYASLLRDGRIHVLGPDDFAAECRFWIG
jgi:hypothetical protein